MDFVRAPVVKQAVVVAFCLAVSACESHSDSTDAATGRDSGVDPRKHAGYIIDSALSMDEELRRFREGSGAAASSLQHALASPEALARAFVKAAATGDTAALKQLHISRTEFAYLYFPVSRFAKPPYELSPALVWFQLTSESDRGITKLMQRLTNNEPIFERIECAAAARIEGENKFWENCTVSWSDKDGKHSGHLFGEIIERDGLMKLLSFANDL